MEVDEPSYWIILGNAFTSFCAEKMEFMIGMYEVERSGETERMRMRGSGRSAESAGALGVGWVMRLMSGGDEKLDWSDWW